MNETFGLQGEDTSSRPTVRPSRSHRFALEQLVPVLSGRIHLPLGALETGVVSRIDGSRSVRDLAAESGLSPYEVLFMLERLTALVPDLSIHHIEVVEMVDDDDWRGVV